MILLLILHLGQVIKLNRLAHLEKSEVPFFLLSLELEEWKVNQIFFFLILENYMEIHVQS